MLSERERRMLERIERHLAQSDPTLAKILSTGRLPRPLWAKPAVLLVTGLLLLLFGIVIAAAPVVMLGIALGVLAMFTAHHAPSIGPA